MRMRTLVYITLGFAGSCGLWVYWDSTKVWAIGIGILMLQGALIGKDGSWIRRAAAVLIGCAAAFWWCDRYHDSYLAPAEIMDGQTVSAEIRIQDFSEASDYGTTADGLLYLDAKPYQVRVHLNDSVECAPGNYLYGSFRFRVTTPGKEKASSYHQGKAVFLMAYQADAVSLVAYPSTRRDIPALLRRQIRHTIEQCFPEESAPFAAALLIGDTSALDYKTDTNLKISGIRHVAAVSGLHVSILFAMLTMISFRNRWMMVLLGYPLLFLFAAVAGFSSSVNRACLMSGLMLLAKLLNREYDGPSALAFSVLVILTVNPMGITSVSLQLSAASVAGIYAFSEGIRKWLNSWFSVKKENRIAAALSRWFMGSIAISFSAMVFTTPLCAWYFGVVSLISPLTNLLTLWMISGCFYGILLVCILFPFHPVAAGLISKLAACAIRYVLLLTGYLAKVPMAAVYTGSIYINGWLIFVYVLLFFFLIQKNKTPWLLSCCAVLGLCLAQIAAWWEPLQTDVRFTVLDVGQGQCLVFQTEGKTVVVDCGGDSDAEAADQLAEFLLAQGLYRIDALILTHLDRDHGGGIQNLFSRIDVDILLLPYTSSDLKLPSESRLLYVSETLELTLGKSKIKIYPPNFPGNSNEMSLCLLFDTENCDILVTGDRNGFGERSLLRNNAIADVDILVAGHHGSRNSTCVELLQAVRPEIVCISAGKNNPYGHPAPELLARLAEYGCSVYRTDLQGTISIRR